MISIILWIAFIASSIWTFIFSMFALKEGGWGKTAKLKKENIKGAIITYTIWVGTGILLFGI